MQTLSMSEFWRIRQMEDGGRPGAGRWNEHSKGAAMNALTADLPLHPALVHLPLGLSLVVPLILLALMVGRRRPQPLAMGMAVALQLAVFSGALVAQNTGGEAEEAAEDQGVPEAAIETHEELAESFTVLAGFTLLALGASAALGQRKMATPALAVAGALSLAALVQGARTGHAGGELVYRHGAGQLGANAAQGTATLATGAAGSRGPRRHDDDDD